MFTSDPSWQIAGELQMSCLGTTSPIRPCQTPAAHQGWWDTAETCDDWSFRLFIHHTYTSLVRSLWCWCTYFACPSFLLFCLFLDFSLVYCLIPVCHLFLTLCVFGLSFLYQPLLFVPVLLKYNLILFALWSSSLLFLALISSRDRQYWSQTIVPCVCREFDSQIFFTGNFKLWLGLSFTYLVKNSYTVFYKKLSLFKTLGFSSLENSNVFREVQIGLHLHP